MTRDIDKLVAEKVMGWGQDAAGVWYSPADDTNAGFSFAMPHSFSTDIAAAWEVVKKLCPTANVAEPWIKIYTSDGKWVCCFHRGGGELFADTAPMAICLAALKAVGEEIPE